LSAATLQTLNNYIINIYIKGKSVIPSITFNKKNNNKIFKNITEIIGTQIVNYNYSVVIFGYKTFLRRIFSNYKKNTRFKKLRPLLSRKPVNRYISLTYFKYLIVYKLPLPLKNSNRFFPQAYFYL